MSRLLAMIALTALVALVAAVAVATAQTPPPSIGDWNVNDGTIFNGNTITITGNVIVSGSSAHLQLTNVNLRFSGSGQHTVTMSGGGKLTMVGGSITALTGYCTINVNAGGTGTGATRLDGVTITHSNGVFITTWHAMVVNCTIVDSLGFGINAVPADPYSRPLEIRGNTITNPAFDGISVVLQGFSGTVEFDCTRNNITAAGEDGIDIRANSPGGTAKISLDRNRVNLAGGNGIIVSEQLHFSELTYNDVYVKNATLDGIHMVIWQDQMLTKYVDRVHAEGNGQTGVYIEYQGSNWDHPIFRWWNVSENKECGVHFANFDCATFSYGYNVNNESSLDYLCDQTDLQIFQTTHRKAMADINAETKYITSYRYLHFRISWQNGEPCKGNTVEFETGTGDLIARAMSDGTGWLPNITGIFDWTVAPTRTTIFDELTPFMTGGTQRIATSPFTFDRDYQGDLVFRDQQAPDLKVEKPATNQVQNVPELLVRGTCSDPHSGVKIVQVSLDDTVNWNSKTWFDVNGTTSWERTFEYVPDGYINVYVRAFDVANWPGGIWANVTIQNITIDTTAPNLTVRPPEPFIITNSTQLTILGFTDPDVVSVSINGEGLLVQGGSFNKQVVLIEGDNTIVVVATDFAGNIAKAIRRIRLDSIAPILIVSYPPVEAPFLRTNRPNVTLGGYTDLADVVITINNQPVTIWAGAWSSAMTLAPGPNNLIIDAVDPAQNHRVVTVPVYYDNVPPEVLVMTPTEGQIVNTSTIHVEGRTSPDILHDQIIINDIYIGVTSGAFVHEFTIIEDGPLNITIRVEDIAGNVVVKVVHIIVDTTAPLIENLTVHDGAIVNTPTIVVAGDTETDATLFVDGSITQLVDGHFNAQTSLAEGRNEVVLRVRDKAGNERVMKRIVFLDTIPPRYELDEVVGNVTRVKESFILLSGNTEAGVNLTFIYGEQTDQGFVDPSGRFEHTIILGDAKTLLIRIRVMDVAGNAYQNELTVIRYQEPEEPWYKESPWLLWGIIILVVACVALIIGLKYGLDATYKRRLKIMGGGAQMGTAYATQPPPPQPQTAAPPPRARPLPPPPPPEDGPGAEHRSPRPPKEGE